jgi:hypothetical protein
VKSNILTSECGVKSYLNYTYNFVGDVLNLENNATQSECPLCGEHNFCGNLSASDNGAICWCVDSKITFPDRLLSQVSDVDKNKKCICKACALKHQLKLGISI